MARITMSAVPFFADIEKRCLRYPGRASEIRYTGIVRARVAQVRGITVLAKDKPQTTKAAVCATNYAF